MKDVRVPSTARKINRGWTRRLFWWFLLIDIAVCVLALSAFCRWTETDALGDFQRQRLRGFACETADAPFPESLSGLTYRFADENDVWHEANMGRFVKASLDALIILLWMELAILILQRLFGAGKARKLLKPLDSLAKDARRLSDTNNRIHSLEDAIDAISPARPDARLTTKDSDMQGLVDALNDLMDRMRAAGREQARFVSDASHELRTPISVIQGYAAMLDRWGKEDPSVLEESIQAIKAETDHMRSLVEQLLFLARGDDGRQKLQVETFDLNALMREVCEESGMIDQNHDWRWAGGENPVPCLGDSGMIKQAARILTDNAAKYTPDKGEIRLRAYAEDGAPRFQVQDTGRGIAGEDLPRIFDRFFRADPARAEKGGGTEKSGGTGLGLSIAKWIVEKHGGYFDVLSRENIGTRITVCLPKPEDSPLFLAEGE